MMPTRAYIKPTHELTQADIARMSLPELVDAFQNACEDAQCFRSQSGRPTRAHTFRVGIRDMIKTELLKQMEAIND